MTDTVLTPQERMDPLMTDTVLTPQEIAQIEADVQKEIDKEAKSKAKEETRKRLLAKARVERGLAEPVEEVWIDLPPDGNEIKINNRSFAQGHRYVVGVGVAQQLRESMQRAWEHQALIEGRAKDHFRKQRVTHVGPSGVSNSPLGPGGLRV